MKIAAFNNAQMQSNQTNFQAALYAGRDRLIPGHLIGPTFVDQAKGSGWFLKIQHALSPEHHVLSLLVKSKEAGEALLVRLASDITKASEPSEKGIVDISRKLAEAKELVI